MRNWDEVVAFTLTLPGTELSSSWGKPSIKVRGKPFVYKSREDGSFSLSVPLPDKEMLLETDPETFWENDHVKGWPAVLVRHDGPAMDRAKMLIERAWWDRASQKLRAERGGARP